MPVPAPRDSEQQGVTLAGLAVAVNRLSNRLEEGLQQIRRTVREASRHGSENEANLSRISRIVSRIEK